MRRRKMEGSSIEEVFLETKKEVETSLKGLLLSLRQNYDKLWTALVEELTAQKLLLEDEVTTLQGDKDILSEETTTLASEANQLRRSVKEKEDKIATLQVTTADLVETIIGQEDKVSALKQRETDLEANEQEVAERGRELRLREIKIDDREKKLQKSLDKVGLAL